MVLFGLAYLLAILLGQGLPSHGMLGAAPAQGVYLAALLLVPPGLWPAMLGVAGLADLAAADLFGLPVPALALAAANGAQALLGATLARQLGRQASGCAASGSGLRDAAALGAAALVAPLAGAALGTAMLPTPSHGLLAAWCAWWVAGALGIVLIVPCALALSAALSGGAPLTRLLAARRLEAALLLAALCCAAWAFWVFQDVLGPAALALPPLVWAALRFGRTGAAAASLLLAASALAAAGPAPGLAMVALLLVASIAAQALAVLRAEHARLLARLAGLEADLAARAPARSVEPRAQPGWTEDAEGQLRFALEAGELGAWSFDIATGQAAWDARTHAIFGVPLGEAVDYERVVWGLVHPEDRARVHAAAQAAVDPAGSGDYRIEHRVLRPGGAVGWVSIRGRTVFNGEGPQRRAARMLGTAQDITARVEAEAELAATGDRLRLAVEAAGLGVCSWNLRTGEMVLSDRCRALYGCPAEAVPSYDWLLGALHPDDRAPTEAAIARALGEQADFDLEHRVTLAEGGERWLRMRGRAELGPDGAVLGLRGVVMDIDPQKRAEATLREDKQRLEAHVAERTNALTLAAAELQGEMRRREQAQAALLQAQKLEALGQLTGGVAHDFNNVLAAVMGSLRLIAKRVKEDQKVQDLAQNGLQAAERAAALVRQLLAFARREDLAPTALDPAAVLAGAEGLVRRALGMGVAVRVEVQPGAWPVLADGHRLEVALLNLAVNARDAMGGNGTLTISARNVPACTERPPGLTEEVDCVVLSVRDNGQGMTPEVLARAAEPFFTTKPRGKGTGLGLAMVHGFAHQSGGALRILSEPGQGTTVEIWLQRAAEAVTPVPEASSEADPSLHGNATVLVVDDDDAVRAVTAAELRDLGYVVIEANSAEAGMVQALAARRLDLLVTDVVMPGGDGPSLAAKLRAERPGVPVLFVTGFAANRQALVRENVLSKPFTPAELGEQVLVALGRAPARDRLLRRMRHDALRQTYLTWRHRRDTTGALPRPEEMDPKRLPGAANAFLLAVEGARGDGPAFRYLSVGPALSSRLGRALDGNVLDARGDGALGDIGEAYRRCAHSGVPCFDYARIRTGRDEEPVFFERLLLPMAADGGKEATHLLGVAMFSASDD